MASAASPPPAPAEAPGLIVGIGASAGGLDPLSAFFSTLPSSDLAFVVVNHLDASMRNLLPEVLGRLTPMPIAELRHGEPLRGGHIYVAPAHSLVTLDGGAFQVSHPEKPEECRHPIDAFFLSLAEQGQAGAVGIILSGHGTDGTIGLKAISDAGGMTIAQDPATAKYDSMPRSAASVGMADRTLSPEKMADELMAYVRHVQALASGDSGASLDQQITDALVAICEVLQAETEHNFKHYKTSTLVRRIGRRMQVLRIASAQEYVARLRESRDEVSALFKELLIGVTAFFRDPEAFDVLAQTVIPNLLENRSGRDPVRVWVSGCATGEEAYSIAMLFREAVDRLPTPVEVSIFATDINEHALRFARQGAYALSVEEDIAPERLQRFFVKKGNRYYVSKELREMCLFSAHDLIRDPPFSRQDLISCRNLLIYLGQHLQKKLIPLFHYALRPSGFLFLGPSESISTHRELFRPIHVKHRISQRMSTAVRSSALLNRSEAPRASAKAPDGTVIGEHDIYLVMQRIILDEFAPKSVVVNQEGQILCSSGGMENYLGIASGIFQNSIVKLAHSGLRVGLRSALSEAVKTSRTVIQDELLVRTEKDRQVLKLTVQPMPQLGENGGLYLVVFQDSPQPAVADAVRSQGGMEQADLLIEQLERELKATREDLEKSIQDLEAANEELKSSNEELLSMNEELQSANEEMETSKEEIQAANEALARTNSDLENLLTSTRIATLFLDEQHHILRFTPAVTTIYNLIPSDVGRSLGDITHRALAMPPFPSGSLDDDSPERESEIQTREGHWYLRRVLPYRNHLGHKEGLVVTFSDVTALKAAQQALEESDRQKNLFLAMLAHELRNPLAPVLNALHLLRDHQLDGALLRQQRDMIERQVQQMKRLLDDLLDVARITSGRISIRDDVVDVSACVEQAMESVRYALTAKQHSLIAEVLPSSYIKGDASRLTQVFTNLLNNSIKFTPKGGRIWVLSSLDGDAVVLRIRDSGIGMSEATLRRAFDLFSQAEQSLDRSEGGLGLGLTLVRRLVELHQGTVTAASKGLGQGSEFVVRLPLTQERPAQPQSGISTRRPARRLCILIVDDNADAAETLAMLLRLVDHEVHTAYDGPAAMNLAPQITPDVVFLDIGLPGFDGYQVARKLRSIPALEATVLIALSGYGQEEDRRRAREAGFDHHLIKPVNKDELFRVLEATLRQGAQPS